jgi:hypothetical protein
MRNKSVVIGLSVIVLIGGLLGYRLLFNSHASFNADLNGDGVVDIKDLAILASNYGKTGQTWAQGDIDGDSQGLIDIIDLSLMASQWGSTLSTRAIDRPATDVELPADAVINVKTKYGARGDGVTDDTAAIQAAISAALGTSAGVIPHKTIYFPKGTYVVSSTLAWKLTNGAWGGLATLQGENRDQTIIKLKDNSPGFASSSAPTPVIMTGSENSINGQGNQAFDNFISDLTIDVGIGNPGAVGIDYLANNRAAIRNVVVRAPSSSGTTGILMTRYGPGPCLLKDIRVSGFNTAMMVSQPEYSVTMENIDLVGQRIAGITNSNNVISIHNLTSNNSVPVVSNTAANGLITIIQASLKGGSGTNPAIENQQGTMYLRQVISSGYQELLQEHGSNISGSSISEYSTGPIQGLWAPINQHSLNLPIDDPPSVTPGPPDSWVSVASYGAKIDGSDASAGIQAALDSGKPIIYMPPGQYTIQHSLDVPSTVKEIFGFDSTLYAFTGDFATADPTKPIMRVNGISSSTTILNHLFYYSSPGVTSIVDGSAGSLYLKDIQMGGYRNEAGAGPLFIEDVGGPLWDILGQQVWARQLNPENPNGTDIINNGGKLWILGLKTERPQTILQTINGGTSELLGGLIYPVEAVPSNVPAFISGDSRTSLIYAMSAYNTAYVNQIQETRSGVTRYAPTGSSFRSMPLFTGY